ncbi:hypothetical protein ACTXT7_006757 [Hymenolepis weldensis]
MCSSSGPPSHIGTHTCWLVVILATEWHMPPPRRHCACIPLEQLVKPLLSHNPVRWLMGKYNASTRDRVDGKEFSNVLPVFVN